MITKAPVSLIARKHLVFPLNKIILGPKQIRPCGVRDIPAEINIIARYVLRVNRMSGHMI